MGLAKRDPRGTGKGGSYAAEAVKRGDIPSIDQHQVEELADERKDAPRYLQSTTSSRIKSAPKDVPECRATPRLSVDLGKENSGPYSRRDKQDIKTKREARSRARSRSRKIEQAPTQDPKSGGRPPLKPADSHMNENAQRKPHVSKKNTSRQRKKGGKLELRTALDSIDSDISQVQREIEALDPNKKETRNDRRRPFAAMTSSGREMACSTSSMISRASSSFPQMSQNEEQFNAESADWRAPSLVLEELGVDSIEATYARTVSRARSVKLLSFVESEDPHLEDNRRFIEKQRQRLERSGSSVHDAASVCSTVRSSASAWAAQAGRSTTESVSSLIAEEKAVQVTVSTDTADALWAEQRPNALWAGQSPDTGSSQSIVSPSPQTTKDLPEPRRSPPSAPPGSPGSVVSFSSVRFRCRRRRIILREGDAAL